MKNDLRHELVKLSLKHLLLLLKKMPQFFYDVAIFLGMPEEEFHFLYHAGFLGMIGKRYSGKPGCDGFI